MQFQSSPFSKEGRYFVQRDAFTAREVFQSSPVTKDGRYVVARQAAHKFYVSILARH